MGPSVAISAASAATVAPVFARSASAAFPAESRSPMMPEPTTAAASNNAPSHSANSLGAKRYSGDFIGRGCGTNCVETFLQLYLVQRADGQAREDPDTLAQFPEGIEECASFFRLRSSHRGRIGDSPMRGHGLTRPDRAGF